MFQVNNLETTINTLQTNVGVITNDDLSVITINDGEIKKIVFFTSASIGLFLNYQQFQSYNYPEYNVDIDGELGPYNGKRGYFTVWLYRKGTTLYRKADPRKEINLESGFSIEGIGLSGYTVTTGESAPNDYINLRPSADITLTLGQSNFDADIIKMTENGGQYYLAADVTYDANAGGGDVTDYYDFGVTCTYIACMYDISLECNIINITI